MGHRAYIDSDFFHTVRNRTAGMIALLAILLHVAVPTLYDLSGPATRGLIQMTICAGGEAKDIYLDRDGKPVQQAPAEQHDCKSCIHHCAAIAVAVFAAAAPRWVAILATPAAPSLVTGLFQAAAHPRGPPA
jgi:NAD-dependent dihydropyrimidine dehydrogenase PreA subunit